VNAAKANDIAIAQAIAKKARNKPTTRRGTSNPRAKGNAVDPQKVAPPSHRNRNQEQRGDTRTVTLQSGGRVTITIAADLFALTDADRKYVLSLIDGARNFESAQQ